MTNKRIIDLPAAAAPTGTELAPVWQSGATVQMTLAAIASLSKSVLRVDLFQSTASSKFDSTTKRVVGRVYFDPTQARWKLSTTSTATFYALIATTNAADAANIDLFQETGTGSPQVLGSANTTGTTATLVSFDVSAYFRPSAPAAIFVPRIWIATNNGTDYATCSGAWIEIQP